MDRSYKREEKVSVYASAEAHNRGDAPLRTIYVKPYSTYGYDSYPLDGVIRPGWRDKTDPTADAAIWLEGPGAIHGMPRLLPEIPR